MTAVNTEILEQQAQVLAEVLEQHNVFGLERNDDTAQMKRVFIDMVLHQGEHPEITDPLILNFADTGAHVELDTYIVADVALLFNFKVVPVLIPNPTLACNPQIDYEALKDDIEFTRHWMAMN